MSAGQVTRRRSLALATLSLAGLIAGGCSATTSRPLAVPTEPGSSTIDGLLTGGDVVDWGDGAVHLLVTTVNAPGAWGDSGPPAGPSRSEADPADVAGDDPTESASDAYDADAEAGTSGGFAIVTAGGTRVLATPPAGLVPVAPADPAEEQALAAAPPGSFVAVDVDGIVGEPGVRYIRSLDALFALDPDVDPSSPVTRSGDTAAAPVDGGSERGDATAAPVDDGSERGDATAAPVDPASGAIDDPWLVSRIERLGGVLAAERVGPGVLAVTATGGSGHAVEDELLTIDGVAAVHADIALGLTDDARQDDQWAIANTATGSQADGWSGVVDADTNADLAWQVTTGAGTVVAVVDSGVQLDHPDLDANIWSNPAEVCDNGLDDDANGFVDDCTGWDFSDDDADPSPEPDGVGADHGTAVAGLVAAARDGDGIVGLAPDARVMPLKVTSRDGRIPTSGVVSAVNYAVANGADVVNLSLATPVGVPRSAMAALEQAIAAAQRAGVVVVAAMGNDGVDVTGAMTWPAGFSLDHDNVIAVGASTNSDTKANFSNTGSQLSMYAPGWAILSTAPGGGWAVGYGTSMAAPLVAAAAADVLAAGVASVPADIRSRLVSTGHDIGVGRRLDLAAAVGVRQPTSDPVVRVTLGGAERATAGTVSTLTWQLASTQVRDATAVRVSVAIEHGGAISAVEGLTAVLSDGSGDDHTLVSDASGAFAPLPVGDGLAANGVTISAELALPGADLAFVLDLVDASGRSVSPAYATYVSVPASSPDVVTSTATGPEADGRPAGSTTRATIATPAPPSAPDPAEDGEYRADALSPRRGAVDGGTVVTIDGEFPTGAPVYVWFGDVPGAVVRADTDADRLTLSTPSVAMAGLRDVIVKFTADRTYELRLEDAFLFGDDSSSGDAEIADGVGEAIGPTTPVTPAGASTPGGSDSSIDGPTAGTADQHLGALSLRRQPTAGPLSRLTPESWPSRGCGTPVCAAYES